MAPLTSMLTATLFYFLLPPPRVSYGLTAEEIKQVVESKLPALERCIASAPRATGALVIHYFILPTGKVANVAAQDSTTGSKSADACIVDVFRALRFPVPRGGVTMEQLYPFSFSAPQRPAPTARLEEQAVLDTVAAHSREIQACVPSGIFMGPGALVVELDIDTSGIVLATRKKQSSTGTEEFDKCILGSARAWRFPKPQGVGILTLAFPIEVLPNVHDTTKRRSGAP